jgi:uncharacterized membrane protein YebE (DUF533 family)
MQRILTVLALVGIGVVVYNAYNKSKQSKKPTIKQDLE